MAGVGLNNMTHPRNCWFSLYLEVLFSKSVVKILAKLSN